MGIKTGELFESDGISHRAWMVRCPACDAPHSFDKRWTFVNGNHEAPTFTASMLVKFYEGDPKDPASNRVCHSYLTDGVWNYLSDCTHAMKGQKIPAPDWIAP